MKNLKPYQLFKMRMFLPSKCFLAFVFSVVVFATNNLSADNTFNLYSDSLTSELSEDNNAAEVDNELRDKLLASFIEDCYTIAQNGSSPRLYSWEASPATNTYVGPLGAYPEIETMAISGDCNNIYAIDGNVFGTVNSTSGAFTPVFTLGQMHANGVTEHISDVDGLAIDNTTGYFWAIERKVPANDLLFVINPSSGQVVSDYFGSGIDYIPLVGAQVDVDDIAFSPVDGELYGISTVSSTTTLDQVVRINKSNGNLTVLATLPNCDIEGITFNNAGQLFGSTGYEDCIASNSLFSIDIANQTTTFLSTLGHNDVEAVACCVAAPPPVCDNFTNPGQIGYDQNFCNSGDPDNIQSLQDPSGGKGAKEYVWMKTTTSCGSAPSSVSDPNWQVIAGANLNSYDPPTISQTTCYVRLARRDNCTDYLVSNIVQILLDCGTVPPNEEDFACTDGVTVDTYGKSCSGGSSTVNILSTSNIFKTVVEVVYKGCHPGSVVVTADGTDYILPQVTLTGNSSDVYAFRGELSGGFSSITTEAQCGTCVPNNGLQSLIAFAFRNVDSGSAFSTVFSSRSGYCDVESFSINIPTGAAARDIDLEIPITEMTNDGRYLTVTASSNIGGASASTTIYGPDLDLGCCLNIVNLTVPNVPADATSINIDVITDVANSPTGGCGQSWVIAANFVADVECTECNLSCNVTLVDGVSCHKGHDGTIIVEGSGGTAPYEFSLDGGPYTVNNTFTNVQYGDHTISVRDATGCEEISCATVNVSEPPSYLVCNLINLQHISVLGANDGIIEVAGSGGGAPYTYTLSGGGPTNTTGLFTGLSAGTYTIEIEDDYGCIIQCDEYTINEGSNSLACQVDNVDHVDCYGGNDGEIIVSASGGGGTYTYNINSGAYTSNNIFSNLNAGNYTIRVQDQFGTISTCSAVIVNGPTENLSCSTVGTPVNVSCYGGSDGSFEVQGHGGTTPYMYSLNGGTPVSSGIFTGQTAGTKTVEVIDANGCTTLCQNITISEPPSSVGFNLDNTTDPTCAGGNDGEIVVSGTGGTTPYMYSINGGTQQGSGIFSNLSAGDYTIEVEDANGCTITTGTITLTDPPAVFSCTVTCDPDNGAYECVASNVETLADAWDAANISKLEGCTENCINNSFTVTSNYNFNNYTTTCGSNGSITVTYTIEDYCGYTLDKHATFSTADTQDPIVTCTVDDANYECVAADNESLADAWNAANLSKLELCSTDDCSPNGVVVASNYDFTNFNATCGSNGSITVTYTITDDCGNQVSQEATFSTADTQDPIVTCTVDDADYECVATNNQTLADAWNQSNLDKLIGCSTDDCSPNGVVVASNYDFANFNATCGSNGSITVTFTITDDCGNQVTQEATFSTADTQDPIVTCTVDDADYECVAANNQTLADAWNQSNLDKLIGCSTDDCSPNGVVVASNYDFANFNATCGSNGSITVTYTITDDCGNQVTQEATFSTADTQDPIVTCTVDDADYECVAANNQTLADAWNQSNLDKLIGCSTDDCSPNGVVVASNYDFANFNATCGSNGSITVTYTITDDCGNQVTQEATFSTADTQDPIVTCTVDDADYECVAANNQTLADAWNQSNLDKLIGCSTDDCSPNGVVVASNYDFANFNATCGSNGSITVTYTITDDCGNQVTQEATFSTADTQDPIVTCTVDDADYECVAANNQTLADAWNQSNLDKLIGCSTDDCSPNGVVVASNYDFANFNATCGSNGSITVTYTITDDCGNQVTQEATFSTADTQDPIVTCTVDDADYECVAANNQTLADAWNQSNLDKLIGCSTDDCSPNGVVVASNYDFANFNATCGSNGSITVTYTITDDCGNQVTQEATFSTADTQDPIVTCTVDDADYECVAANNQTLADAWNQSNLDKLIGCSTDDCSPNGVVVASNYDFANFNATCGSNGSITVTYTITDDCGNQVTQEATFSTADTQDPIVTCTVDDADYECVAANNQTLADAWNQSNLDKLIGCSTDDCSPNGVVVASNYDFANFNATCGSNGSITVTYTITDDCGNQVTQEATFSTADTQDPIVTCTVDDADYECVAANNQTLADAWNQSNLDKLIGCSTDDCSPNGVVVASNYDFANFNATCGSNGSITVTYTITDDCGNQVTQEATFSTADTQDPIVTCTVDDADYECVAANNQTLADAWNQSNLDKLIGCSTDDCSPNGVVVASNYDFANFNATCGSNGSITVTYTITDDCGNQVTQEATFSTADTQDPIVTCTVDDADYECVAANNQTLADAWNQSNLDKLIGCSTDDCSPNGVVVASNYDFANFNATCGSNGSITVTYTITDDCGNQVTQEATFSTADTQDPIVTCTVDDADYECVAANNQTLADAWNQSNLDKLIGCSTDDCSPNGVVVASNYDFANFNATCGSNGSITVTYTITDDCGNQVTQEATFSTADTQDPIVTCTVDDADYECVAANNQTLADAWNQSNLDKLIGCSTDDCSPNGVVVASNYDFANFNATCGSNGSITVTYTITDDCGNQVTQEATFSTADTQDPIVTCTVDDADYECVAANNQTLADAWNQSNLDKLIGCSTDDCSPNGVVVASNYDFANFNATCGSNGSITVTYTITDDCGNQVTQEATFSTADTQDPIVTCTVDDADYECVAANNQTLADAWNQSNLDKLIGCSTDDCSPNGVVVASNYDFANFNATCGSNGSITVTYTITDDCGNQVTQDATFSTADTQDPIVTCTVDDADYECVAANNQTLADAWNQSNLDKLIGCSTDDCSPNGVVVASNYDFANFNATCGSNGSITVTYTITDDCGNQVTQDATFSTADTQDPIVTCTVDDADYECVAANNQTLADAWNQSNLDKLIGCSTDDCSPNGVVVASNYDFANFNATCGSNGSITVTYTITDDCGNQVSQEATFSTADTQDPIVTCIVDDADYECVAANNQTLADAWNQSNLDKLIGCSTDDCSPNGVVVASNYDFANFNATCGSNGSITVTYTITDDCGNQVTQEATFSTADTQDPIVTCTVDDADYECVAANNQTLADAWNQSNLDKLIGCSTDDCSPNGVIVSSDYDFNNFETSCGSNGSITVTYTVADACGNAITQQATFSTADTQDPIVTCTVEDANYECVAADNQTLADTWNQTNLDNLEACSTDDCSPNGVTVSSDYDFNNFETSCGSNGSITVTYTVADACGNAITQQATFSTADTQDPIVTCTVEDANYECVAADNQTLADTWNQTNLDNLEACSTDDCSPNGVIVSSDYDFNNFETSCGSNGSITVTYTVADACGNAITQQATFSTADTQDPIVTCTVEDANYECVAADNQTLADAWNQTNLDNLEACSTDDCSPNGVIVSSDYDFNNFETSCGSNGSITVTYTVADACGNAITQQATFSTADTQDPIVTCTVEDANYECVAADNQTLADIWNQTNLDNLEACSTDDCSPNGVIVSSDYDFNNFETSCGSNGSITVTYTVADACGNAITQQATFSTADTQDPIVTCTVEDANYECVAADNQTLADTWNQTNLDNLEACSTDDCSPNGVIVSSDYDFNNFETSCGSNGSITVTYTVADACGNAITQQATFSTADTQDPIVTCTVEDANYECVAADNQTLADTWNQTNLDNLEACSTDDCSPNGVIVSSDYDFNNFETSCGSNGSITVTYTVADACGNAITQQATFSTADTQDPIVTCTVEDANYECVAADNQTLADTWNQTNLDNLEACSTDDCSPNGVIVSSDYDFNNFETSCGSNGSITVTYTVADACGNAITQQATFSTADTQDPIVTCTVEDANYECVAADNQTLADTWNQTNLDNLEACSTDDCSPNGVIVSSDYDFNNFETSCGSNGSITVTYTVADACGNAITQQATFSTADTQDPIVTCTVEDANYECVAVDNQTLADTWNQMNLDNLEACSTDDCSPNGVIVSSDYDFNNFETSCGSNGSITVTYTVADACGNAITQQATFSTADTQDPIVTCTVEDANYECVAADNQTLADTWNQTNLDNLEACSTDDCSPNGVIVSSDYDFNNFETSCGSNGSITVTYTVADACGNAITQQATFSTADTVAPTISCEADDSQIECVAGDIVGAATTWNDANISKLLGCATDDCSPTGIIVLSDFDAANIVSSCGGGSITVTYTVADACGNSIEDVATFSTEDTVAPTISCEADDSLIECSAGDVITAATSWNNANIVKLEGCATDDCTTTILVTSDFDAANLVSSCGGGSITVTYTIADECGNSIEDVATFSTEDTVAPTISCEADDSLIECSAGDVITAATSWNNANIAKLEGCATDDCATTILVTSDFDAANIVSSCGGGSITVTYTIADECGNSIEDVATFSTEDTVAPTISCEADDSLIECSAGDVITAATSWNNANIAKLEGCATDDCATTILVTSDFDAANIVSSCGGGSITVTYTIADECGNSIEDVATFSTEDTVAPAISCEADDSLIECSAGDVITAATSWNNANIAKLEGCATDDCATTILVTSDFDAANITSSCGGGSITVTYTIADECGNSIEDVATFSTEDTVAPAISCEADDSLIECSAGDVVTAATSWNNANIAKLEGCATDDCATTILVTSDFDAANITSSCGGGSITVTYTIADECGNSIEDVATFSTEDTVAPAISCEADDSLIECSAGDVVTAATSWNNANIAKLEGCATDDCATTILVTSDFDAANIVSSCGGGSITVTYTIADECGNSIEDVATFSTEDTVAPAISCEADDSLIECSAGDVITAATSWNNANIAKLEGCATDDCATTILVTSDFDAANITSSCGGGSITVTYTIADECGNSIEDVATFSTEDTVAPAISCEADDSLIECSAGDVVTAATSWNNANIAKLEGCATDDCATTILVTSDFDAGNITSSCGGGSITVTYTIADECGNSIEDVATFSTEDTVAPTISCEADDSLIECAAGDVITAATSWNNANIAKLEGCATDDCATTILVTSDFDVANITSSCGGGSITVTYTIADECGNSIEDVATFSTEDTVAPAISCEADDSLVECAAGDVITAATSWNNANIAKLEGCATDDCATTILVTSDFDAGNITSSCGGGSITVTYTIADECGNSIEDVATFSTEDTVAPAISCEADDSLVECAAGDVITAATSWNNANIAKLEGCATDDCATTILVTSDFDAGNITSSCGGGSITVTYTIADECGNSIEDVATFSTEDTVAPAISCEADDSLVECGAGDVVTAATSWNNANIAKLEGCATDDCATTILVTSDFDVANITSSCGGGSITVTYTIADECGNSIEDVATFSTEDTVAPAISCEADDSLVECAAGDVVTAATSWNNANIVKLEGCATDDCATTILVTSDFDVANITSSCGGGSITVTYTIADECGNSIEDVATFSTEDTVAPVLSCEADDSLVECAAGDVVTAATNWNNANIAKLEGCATDDCATTILVTSDFDVANITSSCGGGSITVTYTIADECGNSIEDVATFSTEDTVAPVLSCEADDSLVECAAGDVVTAATNWNNANIAKLEGCATDDCATTILVTSDFDVANITSSCGGGSITVTYTIADECGNSIEDVATFSTEDTVAPVLSCEADDSIVECTAGDVVAAATAWNDANIAKLEGCATDDCATTILVTSDFDEANISSSCGGGSITVTYTIADECGNSLEELATFSTADNTDPTVTTQDITIEVDPISGVASITPEMVLNTMSDNCTEATIVDVQPNTNLACGDNIVVLTVTDDCGNTGTAEATVTVNCFDISLTKEVSNATPNVGETVTFTITVTNDFTLEATGVSVTDVLPSGYTNVQNISSGGGLSGSSIVWSGLTIPASGSVSLTFEVEVLATGEYENVAQVTAMDQTDSDSVPNNDDGDQSEDDEDSATIVPNASISGTVLEDIDGDDTGDTPISGVLIELKDLAGAVVASTTTDGSGFYEFVGVAPGDYILMETNPAGYIDVSDEDATPDPDGADGIVDNMIPVSLDAGESDDDNNFVEQQLASISGTVTEDVDNNDTGDSPISGVLIELKDLAGAVIASTTTDGSGFYEFTSILPGDYVLMETNPAGYVDVSDEDTTPDPDGADGIVDNMIPVTLTAGESDENNDFVEEALASISGTVTEDINNDDTGDNPISGVLIELKDLAGAVIASTNTDGSGYYEFTSVLPGEYILMETNPAGYLDVSDEDTSVGAFDPDGADGIVDNMIPVSLVSGEADDNNDFVEEQFAGISGTVTEDLDNDDSGDIGIEGVLIELKDLAGAVVASTTTDVTGFYEFTNVAPGEYILMETDPARYIDVSDEDATPDPDGADGIVDDMIPVTLSPGEADTENDFVEEGLVSVGSTVFVDADNSGVQDGSELGIEGVTVELYDGAAVLVGSTTTDVNGDYFFGDLAPGNYVVAIPTPDATNNTSSTAEGGDNGVDGDDNGIQLVAGGPTASTIIELLPQGESTSETAQGGGQDDAEDSNGDMTIDFGFYAPASIGDVVFFDINGNGLQDIGDPGVDGATVHLLDESGNIIATTNTSEGNYLFDNLAPGKYVVMFVTPNAFTPVLANANGITGETADNAGLNEDSVDSDADPDTGLSHLIMLSSGEIEDEVDAGFNLILDVELVSFNAKYDASREAVALTWITSSEVNNDYFIVERAFENEIFTAIGRVDAVGNSTIETSYNLDDKDVSRGGTYLYRLKQVDTDGTFQYSEIVAVDIRNNSTLEPTISLYPNPTYDFVNVEIVKNEGDEIKIEMFDLSGKVVVLGSLDINSTSNAANIKIPVQNLASATYIVRVNVGEQVFAKKITIID